MPKIEKPDPLADHPDLGDFHAFGLRERILAVTPKARLALVGTTAWFKERDTLAALIRINGYTAPEIIECLTWIFDVDPGSDQFRWANVIRSPAELRKNDKFAKACEHWRRNKDRKPIPFGRNGRAQEPIIPGSANDPNKNGDYGW